MSIIEKVIGDIAAVQGTIVKTIKQNRYHPFRVDHWGDLLQVKMNIRDGPGQSKEVLDLYRKAAEAHYKIVKDMTETINPKDEPYLENLQTPVILELLYEFDPEFKESMNRLVKAIADSSDMIAEEALKRCVGAYGPTWIVDYVATPGSLLNLFVRIMKKTKMKKCYRWTFYTCVSVTRATSYCTMFGRKLAKSLKGGENISHATEEETTVLKKMWLEPMKMQSETLDEMGFTSFDPEVYMRKFKNEVKGTIKSAVAGRVHYANIVLIPAWGAGDFHHIGQSIYNICKDDLAMAILESVTGVLINTLKKGKGKIKRPFQIPISDITAAASMYIMRMDGFSERNISDLMLKRFYNLALQRRGILLTEDLIPEFLDFLARGEKIISGMPVGKSKKIGGLEIDFSPIDKNETIQSPERYSFPACPLTARLSSLLKFADDPFHLESDPSLSVFLTNIMALTPKRATLPVSRCKKCSLSKAIPQRCKHCLSEELK